MYNKYENRYLNTTLPSKLKKDVDNYFRNHIPALLFPQAIECTALISDLLMSYLAMDWILHYQF